MQILTGNPPEPLEDEAQETEYLQRRAKELIPVEEGSTADEHDEFGLLPLRADCKRFIRLNPFDSASFTSLDAISLLQTSLS